MPKLVGNNTLYAPLAKSGSRDITFFGFQNGVGGHFEK